MKKRRKSSTLRWNFKKIQQYWKNIVFYNMFSIFVQFVSRRLRRYWKNKQNREPYDEILKKLKNIKKTLCFTICFQYFFNFFQYGLDDIEKTKKIVDPTMKYWKNWKKHLFFQFSQYFWKLLNYSIFQFFNPFSKNWKAFNFSIFQYFWKLLKTKFWRATNPKPFSFPPKTSNPKP